MLNIPPPHLKITVLLRLRYYVNPRQGAPRERQRERESEKGRERERETETGRESERKIDKERKSRRK